MRAAWLEAALGAAILATAEPAAAKEAAQAWTPGQVLRLEIGGGYMGCPVDRIDRCDWSGFGGPGFFVLGASYDLPIGRTANLSVGGRLLAWGMAWEAWLRGYGLSRSAQGVVEPTVGVTWKFPLAPSVEARVHAGGGLYLGSTFGAAARLGGGMGVSLSPAVDLGFDLLLEVGALGGYGNTTVSFTLGPEFRL